MVMILARPYLHEHQFLWHYSKYLQSPHLAVKEKGEEFVYIILTASVKSLHMKCWSAMMRSPNALRLFTDIGLRSWI